MLVVNLHKLPPDPPPLFGTVELSTNHLADCTKTMCLCLSVRFSYSLFIVQIAPLSFPQIIWPLALGRAARVNRPQLISLNGRPSLFPEPSSQLLLRLLRHLLNCSLLSPTKGSSTNWSGFFDWDLDVDPR